MLKRIRSFFHTKDFTNKELFLKLLNQLNGKSIPSMYLVISDQTSREDEGDFSSTLAKMNGNLFHKTLLIDCDFKYKLLTKRYRLGKQPGFQNILGGQEMVDNMVQPITDQLDFLPIGYQSDNKEILFTKNQLEEVLSNLFLLYGTIIIHTTESYNSYITTILSQSSDNIIMLSSPNRETKSNMNHFLKSLDPRRDKVFGVIFNV